MWSVCTFVMARLWFHCDKYQTLMCWLNFCCIVFYRFISRVEEILHEWKLVGCCPKPPAPKVGYHPLIHRRRADTVLQYYTQDIRGLSQKVVDFCYNTRLCIRNSLKCVWYFYIHFINILYKYGWNHTLNNKVMNVCLTMCQRVRSTTQIILPYFQRGVVKCFDYTPFI